MRRLTTDEFILRAKEIHNNKYDYSLVEYKNNYTKVKIVCPEHGIFKQVPSSHLNGNSCIFCYINSKNSNTDKFILKAKEIHNNKYDYSLVEYKNSKNKIKIICPEHGIFEQLPKSHLEGQKCPKCNIITSEIFIRKAKKIHGDKYDYSLVEYKNNNTKVKIICLKHGVFEQSPSNHINSKNNCPKCSSSLLTTDDFIKKAKEIHNNKYDYSLVEYKNNRTKIKIICPKHGIFEQKPNAHLNKQGCPLCNESKGERIIKNYLKENNVSFKRQKTFDDCKYKYTLKFDFYLLDYNICIEYDGEQHFKSVEYFGGINTFNDIKIKDKIKNDYCKNNNIKIVRIKYNENIIEKLTDLLTYLTINKS